MNNRDKILSSLLAKENLNVVSDVSADTASFDVKSRVLTLPVWSFSDNLKDYLIGHEVGHALYTPEVMFEKMKEISDRTKCPQAIVHQLVNVVEDVRIEKKMLRKYKGLKYDFEEGRKELYKRGAFFTDDENPLNFTEIKNKGEFMDRANAYFKLHFLDGFKFDAKEVEWLKKFATCVTYMDVLDVVEEYIKQWKKQKQENEDNADQNSDSDKKDQNASPTDGDDSQGNEKTENSDSKENKDAEDSKGLEGDSDDEGDQDSDSNAGADDSDGDDDSDLDEEIDWSELESDTVKAVEEFVKNKTKTTDAFLQYEEDQFDDLIINGFEKDFILDAEANTTNVNDERVELAWNIINSNAKELANKFRRVQSADVHKRTAIAKTGELNMNKLSQYQWEEDIFLNNDYVKEGKKHGFVLFIDMSCSMRSIMDSSMIQALSFVKFATDCHIPCQVYSYTSDDWNGHFSSSRWDKQIEATNGQQKTIHKPVLLFDTGTGNKNNRKMVMTQMDNILKLNKCIGGGDYIGGIHFNLNRRVYKFMGYTPTGEAIIATAKEVRKFRIRNQVQVMNTFIITDGQATSKSVGNAIIGGKTYSQKNVANYSEGFEADIESSLNFYKDQTQSKLFGIYLSDSNPVQDINTILGKYRTKDEKYESMKLKNKNTKIYQIDKSHFDILESFTVMSVKSNTLFHMLNDDTSIGDMQGKTVKAAARMIQKSMKDRLGLKVLQGILAEQLDIH